MEAKDPKSTETENAQSGTEAVEPDSSATSNDTLSDVEQAETVSTTSGDERSGGSANDAPSPDGQFDGSRSENSGTDDAGPM